jgi:ubiquinone/menaquinone biosynthesis C-methylase UbiE
VVNVAVHTSSYDPANNTAGGLDAEIRRLDAQAALSFDEELRIFREAGVFDGGPVLEVGCGPGAITTRLRTAIPDASIVGVDIDQILLGHARDTGVPLVAADAMDLPFQSGRFGGALIRYVLQHLAEPSAVLAEVSRVLRPGAAVALIDVDSALWGMAEPFYPELAPVQQRMAQAQRNAGGDRMIGRRLTRMLSAAGFVDVSLRTFAVTSDGRPMSQFAPLLGPDRLAPLVAAGTMSIRELALAANGWQKFSRDPDAWIMLLGLVAVARTPGGAVPEMSCTTSGEVRR